MFASNYLEIKKIGGGGASKRVEASMIYFPNHPSPKPNLIGGGVTLPYPSRLPRTGLANARLKADMPRNMVKHMARVTGL